MSKLKTREGLGGVTMRRTSLVYTVCPEAGPWEWSCASNNELRFRNGSVRARPEKLQVSNSGHRSKGKGRTLCRQDSVSKSSKGEISRMGEKTLDSQ